MEISKISEKYNQAVRGEEQINCSQEKIWNVIAQASNLELFHPFCSKNPIIAWQENDHRDEIHYINGFKLKRRFIAWNEGVGYDLVIGTIKEKESFVSWRIHQTNDQNIARITIDIYPYIMNRGNKLMERIPFELYIRPQLSSYLNSVLGGLNWHIKNNKPTPKNHFGTHKWFSKIKEK